MGAPCILGCILRWSLWSFWWLPSGAYRVCPSAASAHYWGLPLLSLGFSRCPLGLVHLNTFATGGRGIARPRPKGGSVLPFLLLVLLVGRRVRAIYGWGCRVPFVRRGLILPFLCLAL